MGSRRGYNFLACVIQSSKPTSLWLLLRLVVVNVLLVLGRRTTAAVCRDWGARRWRLSMIEVVVLVTASARFLVSASLLVTQECGHGTVVTSPATRWTIVAVATAE
jgi:hypothetical protein